MGVRRAAALLQRFVLVTRAEGGTKTVAVRNSELQARLPDLKAGDQVDITYTGAIELKVERTTE